MVSVQVVAGSQAQATTASQTATVSTSTSKEALASRAVGSIPPCSPAFYGGPEEIVIERIAQSDVVGNMWARVSARDTENLVKIRAIDVLLDSELLFKRRGTLRAFLDDPFREEILIGSRGSRPLVLEFIDASPVHEVRATPDTIGQQLLEIFQRGFLCLEGDSVTHGEEKYACDGCFDHLVSSFINYYKYLIVFLP